MPHFVGIEKPEGAGGGGAVDSVNGETGAVELTAADIPIVDAAGDFTATEVEGALAELQADAEAHTAAVSGIHGITAAAATVLDDTTVGAMVNTLGGAASTGTGGIARATSPALVTPDLGTPSAATLTNATGLPLAGVVDSTTDALGVGSLEVGHASDTTLARASAGNLTVEGNALYRAGGTDVPVADGGTGVSTLASRGVLIGRGTSAVEVTAVTIADLPLVANGSGINPEFKQLNLGNGGVAGILPFGNIASWTTYVPTVDQGATTNIAKTVIFARYIRAGNIVIGHVRLSMTAGGTSGSAITITIPVTHSTLYASNIQVGSGSFTGSGIVGKAVMRITNSTGLFEFLRTDDSTTSSSAGISPAYALASGNVLAFTFIYEAET